MSGTMGASFGRTGGQFIGAERLRSALDSAVRVRVVDNRNHTPNPIIAAATDTIMSPEQKRYKLTRFQGSNDLKISQAK